MISNNYQKGKKRKSKVLDGSYAAVVFSFILNVGKVLTVYGHLTSQILENVASYSPVSCSDISLQIRLI